MQRVLPVWQGSSSPSVGLRDVLWATLEALRDADQAGSTVHLPFEWPEPAEHVHWHPAKPSPIMRLLSQNPALFAGLTEGHFPPAAARRDPEAAVLPLRQGKLDKPQDKRTTTMAARLPYLEREKAPADIQALYDGLQKAMGRVPNMAKLMAYHAKSLPPFFQWYPTLREGALDIKLRQLAYVKVSQLNQCHY